LRNLLTGIVDYAGLFPPAKLPLEQALRNYARYRTEPDSWMLGRFICPAAQLAELAPFHDELFQSGPPFAFSALGRGGATVGEFLEGLRADREAINAFRARHGARVVVDVLEVRLPRDLLQDGVGRRVFFSSVKDLIERDGPGLAVYYEASLGPGWRPFLRELIPALDGGFKLRCGGLEASAFPTPEQVAFALSVCTRERRPFKATAGLHHPIRHFDRQLQTPMHGFLNVFGAGVLASVLNLSEDQVRPIIEDEDPSHFVFAGDGFRWQGLAAPVDAIVQARREHVVSFGSCSFDEPRADLRTLGFLAVGEG
jgi:hypothetical protein